MATPINVTISDTMPINDQIRTDGFVRKDKPIIYPIIVAKAKRR